MQTLPLVILLLATSVFGVLLFRRMGMPPVLGYLLVGSVIGPHALNLFGAVDAAGHLAEFGVVFLMFSIGLEFSLPRLFAMKRTVFGLGGLQVALTLAVAGAAALALGLSPVAALALGGALAMSSTAVLVKLLADRGAVDSSHGRQVVGVLLFQDIAVVPLLVLIPSLSGSAEQMAGALGIAFLKATAMLLLVLFVGQRLMGRWFDIVARGKSSELFMLNVLLIVLGLSFATELAGLSLALGAFVAGMLISETAYRHHVQEDIKPFRDVLLGLFFVTVGMQLDWSIIGERWFAVLALLVGILSLKGVIVGLLAKWFGASSGDSLRVGLWLCAGGEFGFVLLKEARGLAVVPEEIYHVVLAALVLSMLLAAVIVHFSEKLVMRLVASEWLLRSMELTRVAARSLATEQHAIICGFGRNGQYLARFLAQERISYMALDLDPDRVRDAAVAGESVVFGDSTRKETLLAAGLKRARVVVVTFASVEAAERIVAVVQELRPDLPVVVRTDDEVHIDRLFRAGAAEVVPEALESSLMLASHALMLLGVPPRRVLARIRETRRTRYTLMRGLFQGTGSDEADDLSENASRLHSVVLNPGAHAVGRRLGDLALGSQHGEVSAIRRRGNPALRPGPDTEMQPGDVVVLLGTPEQLANAEHRLLKG
jgi:CPA2 family monovalent cation:H+ antiporter-2